jgi:ubiquitin fusion degradation protein 1
MYFGGYGMLYPSTPFEQNYRCYSASFIDKPHLENGDKVVMPPSALDRLASLRIDYPMLFEVHNPSTLRTSHCGVLEFVAEEGMIYMPYWMMQNMLLQEGDIVRVKSATLPKGTFVKLQPHTKDFLDISNPKAVLETTLRNFSCLTAGDNIMVAYNNKKYYIDIIESKPANAISIIETDCEVDFAPPLDYKEPERVTPPPVPVLAPSSSQDTAPPEPEEPKFNAFTGTGRRLDGKPGSQFTSSIPATTTSPIVPSAITASAQRPTGTPPAGAQRPSGKLVFGGGSSNGAGIAAAQISSAKKKEIKEEMKEPEGPKFQAFTGRKYSLRD